MTANPWPAALFGPALCLALAACGPPADRAHQDPDAEARLRVAAAAEASGNRDMAAGMFRAAADAAPADTTVQVRAAEGLARNGRLEEARDLIAKRAQAAPRDASLRRTLGSIEILSGRAAEAVRLLTEVLRAEPDDVKALVNRGVALDVLQQHKAAQADYRRALALSPGDATVSNDLALSLMLSGRLEDARQVLAPFRGQTGLPDRIGVNLGILDAAAGRPELAQSLLNGRIAGPDLANLSRAIGGGAVRPQP
jgi:tetratricopeptide (TPR) repeat protein